MLYLLIFFIILNAISKKHTNLQLDLYFGTPGSGKSTFLAKIGKEAMRESSIITYCKDRDDKLSRLIMKSPFFKRAQTVYANFDLVGALRIDPREDLGKYLVENAVILLDELGIVYNNRDFRTFPTHNRKWFKYQRHEKCYVAMASQGVADVDLTLRNLTHNRFIVTKIPSIGLFIAKKVRKKIAVINGVLTDIDETPTFLADWDFCFGKSVWDMYDSYSRLNLPEKPDGWEKIERTTPLISNQERRLDAIDEYLDILEFPKDSIWRRRYYPKQILINKIREYNLKKQSKNNKTSEFNQEQSAKEEKDDAFFEELSKKSEESENE